MPTLYDVLSKVYLRSGVDSRALRVITMKKIQGDGYFEKRIH